MINLFYIYTAQSLDKKSVKIIFLKSDVKKLQGKYLKLNGIDCKNKT